MEQPGWINRTLGQRYTIEALIGQGGMSAVYKANDPNLKRVVAIKLIHPHLETDTKFIQRFEEEATTVAKLRHPNIVQVFDFNIDEGTYYIVLEFIPGETLQERLRRLNKAGRQLSLEEAIKFTINICDALGYAHKQGLIHRDIKPANIMLDVHGQAVLMDFGIVKIIGGESHTATGAVVGTARYMSPEVIRSESPDQRSDIYSLGITLYEMLNGDPPFNADSAMSLMMMHLHDPVPDLHSIKPNVPPELTGILQRSLEKDPDRRYGSAGEMAADLKRVLAALETRNPFSEPTMPDAIAAKTYQAETQIDAPAREKTPAAVGSEQMAENIAPPRSQKPDYVTTKEDTGISVKAMDIPLPGQPAQTLADRSVPRQTHDQPASKHLWLPLLLGFGAGGVILIIGVIAGMFLLKNFNNYTVALPPDTPVGEQQVPSAQPVLLAATEPPTMSPTLASMPTSAPATAITLPPLYVRINNISTNSSYQYVVEYETFGFIEALPGMHVHFFFDTVPPEQAGEPGNGPWIMYAGPSPFTGYSEEDRPSSATQMCALVTNASHSVIQGSGNCINLP